MGIDLVGPLPITEEGKIFIMNFQDHFTRWPAAFHLEKATGIEVVACIRLFCGILVTLTKSCLIEGQLFYLIS